MTKIDTSQWCRCGVASHIKELRTICRENVCRRSLTRSLEKCHVAAHNATSHILLHLTVRPANRKPEERARLCLLFHGLSTGRLGRPQQPTYLSRCVTATLVIAYYIRSLFVVRAARSAVQLQMGFYASPRGLLGTLITRPNRVQ